jgi:hypothetical protein
MAFLLVPKREIDGFVHDPEVDKVTHELMYADSILLGDVTYQMSIRNC